MGFTEIKYASPLSLLLVFPSSLLSWLPTAFSLLPPPQCLFPSGLFHHIALPLTSAHQVSLPLMLPSPLSLSARLFPCSSSLSIHRSLNNSLINRLIISNCSCLLFLSLQPCPCQSLSQSPSLTNVIHLINSRKNANLFFFCLFFPFSLSLHFHRFFLSLGLTLSPTILPSFFGLSISLSAAPISLRTRSHSSLP